MPVQEFSPHPLLAAYVQNLWWIERRFTAENPTFDILPDSKIELVFSFGAPCVLRREGGAQVLEPCYVVGLLNRTVRVEADGLVRLIGVRFYPWGFSALLGDLLERPALGLHLTGGLFVALAAKLSEMLGQSTDAAVHELEQFLIARALSTTQAEPELIDAALRIVTQKGDLSLDALSEATSLSSRTLRRRFNAILGLAPKSLARTARFEGVCNALWLDPDADLVQVALSAGYADQAHMQREFRDYSARTPREFAAEMRQLRSTFENNAVRNLQET